MNSTDTFLVQASIILTELTRSPIDTRLYSDSAAFQYQAEVRAILTAAHAVATAAETCLRGVDYWK